MKDAPFVSTIVLTARSKENSNSFSKWHIMRTLVTNLRLLLENSIVPIIPHALDGKTMFKSNYSHNLRNQTLCFGKWVPRCL